MQTHSVPAQAGLPQAKLPHRPRWPVVAAAAASLVLPTVHPADAEIVEGIWHVFSRACYNGPMETVTYNRAGVERLFYTESEQYVLAGGIYVSVGVHVDDWRNTWRSYAGTCCWTTPSYVLGRHYAEYPVGHQYKMHDSSATDCNPGEWLADPSASLVAAPGPEAAWMQGLELDRRPPPASAPAWLRTYPGWAWSVGSYRPPVAGAESTAQPRTPSIVPYPGMNAGEGPHGGLAVGKVTEVSIDELPPAMREAERKRLQLRGKLSSGVESVGERDGYWPEPLTGLVAAPGERSPGQLRFTPVDVKRVESADLAYLGAEAADDAMPDEAILSAVRYFRHADGVDVALYEDDFSHGGALLIVREAQNARVGDHDAELVVQRSPSGRVRSLLSWADAHTHYTISVDDDVDHPRGWARFDRAWLLGVAAGLGR